jgi:hypothetical protein
MLINWFFSKTYRIKCPDGTIKSYVKDIDKAFPLSLKDTQAKIDSAVSLQKEATANLNVQYASKIQGLLFSISEQNKSLMLQYRSAYFIFQTDPCSNNSFLIRQFEHVNSEQQNLMELKTKLEALINLAETFPTNGENVFPLYQEIVSQIKGKNQIDAALLEIKENIQSATKWIKGDENG